MKKITLTICLLLVLGLLLSACGSTDNGPAKTEPPATQTAPATTAAPVQEDPMAWEKIGSWGKVGTVLPDFSVKTADGGSFTLSEALKDHELVLINLWATWCPPCNMEFPFLQTAYETAKDRVAVIALSVEESDTLNVIKKTAEEKQLSFPMGRDEGYRFTMAFNVNAIPTSLLVDRDRKVLWLDSGAMSSAHEFLDLFNAHLQGGETLTEGVRYSVTVLDQDGNPVPGCMIGFCTDEACVPVMTDAEGSAVYLAEPYSYHVQLLSLPEGYDYSGADDMVLMEQGEAVSVTVSRVEE